jgi:hypothetical protein|tara:strand:- start:3936 stop:4799 length:864 start_codon:yes stop_codon:yes gene_type:complete
MNTRKTNDRHLVVFLGDTHCGSTVGLCPDEGLELDDGGWYQPNKSQQWLWENWLEAWDRVAKIKKIVPGTNLHIVMNGDAVDGDHHKTAQIASRLTGIHVRCFMESIQVPLSLGPDSIHIIRGTAAHVGESGNVEEGIARALSAGGWPVVGDPDTGQKSSYWRKLTIGDVKIDVKHHGRMGKRAHTKGPYIRWYAQDIFFNYAMDGETPPDLAVRSHFHQFADSGQIHKIKTRAVALPAWQLATEYVHRVAESLADIGLVCAIIEDGHYTIEPILFRPQRPTEVVVK